MVWLVEIGWPKIAEICLFFLLKSAISAILIMTSFLTFTKFWIYFYWNWKVFLYAFRPCIVCLGYFQQLDQKITLNTGKNCQNCWVSIFYQYLKSFSDQTVSWLLFFSQGRIIIRDVFILPPWLFHRPPISPPPLN